MTTPATVVVASQMFQPKLSQRGSSTGLSIFFLLLAASDDDESAHRRISPALKILIAFPFAQHNRERFTHHVERELSSFRGWLDKGGRVLLSSLYFFA